MQDRGILPSVVEHTIKTGSKTTSELGYLFIKIILMELKLLQMIKERLLLLPMKDNELNITSHVFSITSLFIKWRRIMVI